MDCHTILRYNIPETCSRKFGISGGYFCESSSVFLDIKGMVFRHEYCWLFGKYGTPGYPFTAERIRLLDSEDDATAKQASLESLLGSPERDYVISNKGDRVPIHTLKDKVVALYFYEDRSNKEKRVAPSNFFKDVSTDDELTRKLMMAYKELAINKENFEVVLLYLYDTRDTLHCTNEESFWKIFKTMPWLALPFKDPIHKKLKRIFGYANEVDVEDLERPPELVIFGPDGEFVDPRGADILREFGTSAYPFTLENLVKLETEKLKELKLEMLWDPNTVSVKKDGLEIPLSQFSGKRLLIYFDMYTSHDDYYHIQREDDLMMMEYLYLKVKGTNNEFEVIYMKKSPLVYKPDCPRSSNDKGYSVPDCPWMYYGEGYSLPKELEHGVFKLRKFQLIAFDRDGSIVWKTFNPTFRDEDFPFHAGDLEQGFLDQLNYDNLWGYWNRLSYIKPIYQRGQSQTGKIGN